MSLFNSIFSDYDNYILEDNTGEDDNEDANPDELDMNNVNDDNPPEDEGEQEPEDEPTGDNEDPNPDELDMNNGEEGGEPTPQNDTEGDEPPAEDPNPDDLSMGDPNEGEPTPQDDTGNDNPPGNGEENPSGEGDEPPAEDPNPDDLSMDNAGDGEEGGESTGTGVEDTPGDTEGEDQTDTEGSDDYQEPSSKLNDLQKSIFDQLSPEQQELKIKELKSLYTDVYDKCSKILEIIVAAEKVPSQTKVYDYITNTLTDLQKYIKDYLENIFDSRTYIENMVELQKYMTILDTVNNVFDELKKNNNKKFAE